MTEEEDRYLDYAIAALELAQQAQSREAEDRLLRLAGAWRDLAEHARRDPHWLQPLESRGSLQLVRDDLGRGAILAEIGKGLRAEYAALEEPVPERLTVLVEKIDRMAA